MIKTIIVIFILLILFPVVSYSEQIGSAAPVFNLTDINGQGVSLEQFKGKVVLLTFWAPWCAPCCEELPVLEELHRKYRKDGFAVVSVSMQTSESGVVKLLRKLPVSFTVLLDKKGDVSDAYRVSGLPEGFIIGRDGVIRRRHRGFGREFLPIYEKEIAELLNQK
jgi:peroxiredoxin